MYNTSRKKERKKINCKLFTKNQSTASQPNGKNSRSVPILRQLLALRLRWWNYQISALCLCLNVAGQGYKAAPCHYQFIPAVVGGRWIELSENDKSVLLGPVFQLNMQNKMQISSYLRSSSKSARLGFTRAIEKAETQRQWRDCEMKKSGKTA